MSIYDSQSLLIYCVIVAAIIGAVAGSFLNCAAWRITHGESFLTGRSHCTACGHVLGPLELIPVFSWVIQKGKCKSCGQKISVRYPLTELFFAAVTVICLLRFDLTVLCLRNFLFLCCLFLLTLTDLEDMIIPDGCHIAAVIIWAVAAPFLYSSWWNVLYSILAAVVYGGGLLAVSLLLDRILGRDSLGGGDIKLFAVIGLYLGMIGTLFTVMIACIVGLLVHAIMKAGSSKNDASQEGAQFPFGPYIAFAAAIMLLFGEPLIRWYQSLLM